MLVFFGGYLIFVATNLYTIGCGRVRIPHSRMRGCAPQLFYIHRLKKPPTGGDVVVSVLSLYCIFDIFVIVIFVIIVPP